MVCRRRQRPMSCASGLPHAQLCHTVRSIVGMTSERVPQENVEPVAMLVRGVQMNLKRPTLFPAPTAEQLSPEAISEQLERDRDVICHPLAGIYSDEEWEEYKAECAARTRPWRLRSHAF
jgi:hypothetical protein